MNEEEADMNERRRGWNDSEKKMPKLMNEKEAEMNERRRNRN